jgi:hypothetical protein
MKLEGNAGAPPRCEILNSVREFDNPWRLYKSSFGPRSPDQTSRHTNGTLQWAIQTDFLRVMETRLIGVQSSVGKAEFWAEILAFPLFARASKPRIRPGL